MFNSWEILFESEIARAATSDDPAHDILHFKRVVALAKKLAQQEEANLNIVVPAAWLHDCVVIPKNSPQRSQASQLSAKKALEFLQSINYPEKYFAEISHAIAAHSFSANIKPETLEAQIVQDADRLDGLGAIGIARCFATAGVLKRTFYCSEDPFCDTRTPNDSKFTVDHFYAKLFSTAETLKTKSGSIEGQKRVAVMKHFISFLRDEIDT
ncbi:MAG: HD domain-containing protein [Bdellovibrionales bacterium]